jgi:hypothetical protein
VLCGSRTSCFRCSIWRHQVSSPDLLVPRCRFVLCIARVCMHVVLSKCMIFQHADGVHRLQQLAGWVSEGGLTKADAGLLQLVVPICLQQLRSTLQQQQQPAADDSRTMQLHFYQVWLFSLHVLDLHDLIYN